MSKTIKYRLVDKIIDAPFPHHHPDYKDAHAEACKAEKAKYPEGYARLRKLERGLGKDEYLGMNKPDGTLLVSKKVPEEDREEVAYHEYVEHKAFGRMDKEHHRSIKE